MRPIIQSTKHMVQTPISTIAFGVRENIRVVNAVAIQDKNLSSEVVEGAIVKAVYCEMWVNSTGVDGAQVAILEKTQGASTGANIAEMASLFTYDNKKNILWTHEGLSSNESVGNPIPIIRQWIKIPKGKQRFGLGDGLSFTISNISAADPLFRCGFFVYKEMT